MDSEVLVMSEDDILRINTVGNVVCKHISQAVAAGVLKVTDRHIRRLVVDYKKRGPKGLISKRRGQPANNRIPDEVKAKAVAIIKEDYYDYGPTLAAEKLEEYNGIKMSKETARQLMIKEGIWRARQKRVKQPHPLRPRRACEGELIQLDGSPHPWFEDRAPECTLLVCIDDATSKIMRLLFAECESTLNYFKLLKGYFLAHGKSGSIYSDKHVVFKVNHPNAKSGNGLTQYGRALDELGIDIIYASTPEAKGRVERVNQTLQDRLVKELRLRNISTIEEANEFLEEYIEKHNNMFAKPPESSFNVHRPLSEQERKDLNKTCSFQTQRIISKDLEVRYNSSLYKIIAPDQARRLAREKVLVCEDTNGELIIYHNDKPLQYEVCNKTYKEGHILSDKELNSYLNKQVFEWKPIKQAQEQASNTEWHPPTKLRAY